MHVSRSILDQFDTLQKVHGDPDLNSVYGAGQADSPDIMLMFMNPTGRNISAHRNWEGLIAPWIGTKGVWGMLHDLGLFNNGSLVKETQDRKGSEWDVELSKGVYDQVKKESLYITNIAKCTQVDARPLPNSVFKEYLPTMFDEISEVNPKVIITFGNQVSSVFLGKGISVSGYTDMEKEVMEIGGSSFDIFPCYYPVGQGRRNMPIAKERIKKVIDRYI